MSYAELKINGSTFVLVPKDEFRRIAKSRLPSFPPQSPDGTYPALEFSRVSIARKIIQRREAAGLSQKDLAAQAGVRAETLNRLEKARVNADMATILKIEKVLKKHRV